MNLAIFMNTNELGGAERSIIEQVKVLSEENQLIFYIPVLDIRSDKIENYVVEKIPNAQFKYFNMNSLYYRASRKGRNNYIAIILGLLSVFQSLLKINFKIYDKVWLNGNKVGFPLVVFLSFFSYKGEVLYHLRDYPSSQLKWLRRFIAKLNLHFLSNSTSVNEKLKEMYLLQKKSVIYNPVEQYVERDINGAIEVIGVAAMMTPWKGVHQVIEFANLYEAELRDLGIVEINIYGSSIYKTKNRENNYLKEIKELTKNKLVNFKGLVTPRDIYDEIDLLIHPSIEPEPFGRVITEAYINKVPVLSTSIGGSSELISHEETGIRFSKYDYAGLMHYIRKVTENSSYRKKMINNAHDFSMEINADVQKRIRALL